MSPVATGALIGAALAIAALLFGFWGFLLVAVFMVVGALIGALASGRTNANAIFGAFTGRRSS